MTAEELREQDALPGGRVGPATRHENGTRTWQAAGSDGHSADPSLEHTTIRWHEGGSTAGGGWYVVTSMGRDGRSTARTGPFGDDETLRLEEHLARLCGTDRDRDDEAMIAVVAEAANVRMAEAASRLTIRLGIEREQDALAGLQVRSPHHRDERLTAAGLEETAARLDLFDALRDAVETRTRWQQS